MDFKLIEMLTLSSLEKGRVEPKTPSPRNLAPFSDLDALIFHSLKVPNLLRTQTPEGTQLKNPQAIQRPFQDEALLEKLLQYRSQIPTSGRIIRAQES